MNEQIKIKKEGSVRIIEFYNPPYNYITLNMLRELYTQLLKDRDDDSIRVMVLSGGLEDTFLTHYDVDDLIDFHNAIAKKRSPATNRMIAYILCWLFDKMDRWPWLERIALKNTKKRSNGEQSIFYWTRCLQILENFPKPIIAAINGLALGGGCEISLCCDFRYMANGDNYRIGLPEVLLGITPGGTGTPLRLPRIIGEGRAMEMLMTGGIYPPSKAEAMGLINQVLPPDEFMPVVMKLAKKLSRGAPIAQACIRKSVRKGSRMAWSKGQVLEMAGALTAMNSEDAGRGMEAYVTHVASQFKGVEPEKRFELYDDLNTGHLTDFKGE